MRESQAAFLSVCSTAEQIHSLTLAIIPIFAITVIQFTVSDDVVNLHNDTMILNTSSAQLYPFLTLSAGPE